MFLASGSAAWMQLTPRFPPHLANLPGSWTELPDLTKEQ